MTTAERRASASLASLFALRMLGLFLVLPVFALEAARYPGGDDPARVGLALGIYGLTQGLLQIPLGMASDRWGRKRVILLGLAMFALGSVVAALADSLTTLTLGRALQGAGAISAAVTAFLADVTRDTVRTKAMAVVGMSIALMFALSLVVAPALAAQIGLAGLFWLTAALAVSGMAVVVWLAPAEPLQLSDTPRGGLREVLAHPGLLRLDVGVFALHAVQLAMWVALPGLLVQAGLPAAQHWQLYLPAVLLSFGVIGALLFRLERQGRLRAVFLVSIGLIGLVQVGLWWASRHTLPLPALTALVLVFFVGFNALEASQPSLVSRLAPTHARGAALGVYNTLQSLGFFAGGALGGWLARQHGTEGLFAACAAVSALWLWVTWHMQAPGRAEPARASAGAEHPPA